MKDGGVKGGPPVRAESFGSIDEAGNFLYDLPAPKFSDGKTSDEMDAELVEMVNSGRAGGKVVAFKNGAVDVPGNK